MTNSIKIPVEYGVHSHIQRECSRGPIRETSRRVAEGETRTPRRARRAATATASRGLSLASRGLSRVSSRTRVGFGSGARVDDIGRPHRASEARPRSTRARVLDSR